MNDVQNGKAIFQPRARLLKLIGAELISDEVVALAELAKNAHDADASAVTITFRNVTGSEGEILVRDDGQGMDLEGLLRHWMEPAGTSKARSGGGRFSKRGRRVLGEKGVGRFAADKLARSLELISFRAGDDTEIRAIFDWDEFDDDSRMLADIECGWEVRRRSGGIRKSGTILRLTQLRTAWNERMFRRVSTRLARLCSPSNEKDVFRIHIESDEFPQYSGELRSDFLALSPYRMEASFDGQQSVEITVNGSRSASHLWNGSGDLRCGPVTVRLSGFDLDSEAIAHIGPGVDVRGWLREWSGVSIYRDGFRVWPYGEPHDDWLRLDQRRVNQPVVRLSNNQVVGFVEISSDRNPDLKDQTNREGLINNRALEDLRRLLYFLLQILEAERQSIRHPKSSVKAAGSPKNSTTQALETLAATSPRKLQIQLNRVATQATKEAARETQRYQRLIEGYSELAALGQAAAYVSASARLFAEKIALKVDEIEKAILPKSNTRGASNLCELRNLLTTLFSRIGMLTPMERATGNKRTRVTEILAQAEMYKSMIGHLLESRGVHMIIEGPPSDVLHVQMRPEVLYRILYILTVNSLDWLRAEKSQIRISVGAKGNSCEIIFSDNGPGIRPPIANKVFEPLFSTREGACGMGLTIAREMVTKHGGSIEVITDQRRRGANIRIVLPLKRSRSTPQH